MGTLKKYTLDGQESGEIELDGAVLRETVNSQMVKDYIVALRNNARQWAANTKTRAEVKHTTKKPHKQKGTGRARQGNLVTPQFRGGGIVFGPKPKFDQHVRINKKERRAAIHFLFSEKVREGRVRIIETTEIEKPRTKQLAQFIKGCGIDGRILFLGERSTVEVEVEGEKRRVSVASKKHQNFARSLSNIPKASFSLAMNVSGYDVVCARELVLTEEALNELKEWLCG